MFKELDIIYFINNKNEEEVLAKKKDGIWTCILCDENEDYKRQIINHIRYTHILDILVK